MLWKQAIRAKKTQSTHKFKGRLDSESIYLTKKKKYLLIYIIIYNIY